MSPDASPKTDSHQLQALPPADAYVFDIDGTLLTTRDLVHWNALQQAMLEVYGVHATIDGIPYHGMTDLSILRAALTRERVQGHAFEAALPRALEVVCREVESRRHCLSPQVCPGVEQILRTLRQRGCLVGLASGNLATVGWCKIEAAGLREFFSFGFFSDSCEVRAGIFSEAKAHVAQELGPQARTCFIGDTPADIQAARQVGASIVAVASGTFSLSELSACAPDVCASHCGELLCSL